MRAINTKKECKCGYCYIYLMFDVGPMVRCKRFESDFILRHKGRSVRIGMAETFYLGGRVTEPSSRNSTCRPPML